MFGAWAIEHDPEGTIWNMDAQDNYSLKTYFCRYNSKQPSIWNGLHDPSTSPMIELLANIAE